MRHHHPTHAHHPHDRRAHTFPSLLRMAAWERLAGSAVLIAALWGAIFWAVR